MNLHRIVTALLAADAHTRAVGALRLESHHVVIYDIEMTLPNRRSVNPHRAKPAAPSRTAEADTHRPAGKRRNEPGECLPNGIAVVYVLFSALLIVSAFDHRFGWSHMPMAVCLSGDVLVAIGLSITMLVLVVVQNTYAAATGTVEATPEGCVHRFVFPCAAPDVQRSAHHDGRHTPRAGLLGLATLECTTGWYPGFGESTPPERRSRPAPGSRPARFVTAEASKLRHAGARPRQRCRWCECGHCRFR